MVLRPIRLPFVALSISPTLGAALRHAKRAFVLADVRKSFPCTTRHLPWPKWLVHVQLLVLGVAASYVHGL